MNKLYIDTRDSKRIVVRLETEKGILEEESVARHEKAQATLPLIEKLLKKVKLSVSDIDEINIERGPGSFTGLRVGISIANALSFTRLVRVNGRKIGEIEQPQY